MKDDPYRFHNVSEASTASGVYAWYCRHSLAAIDVETVILSILNANFDDRPELVEKFLEKHIFRYFAEQPYQVRLTGKLKPKYEGPVHHLPQVSSSLVSRISSQPERLREIAYSLSKAMPNFLSPIYIGSATSLRKRLLRHCDLIRKYRNGSLILKESLSNDDDEDLQNDHSFAHEVAMVRRYDPNDLWVYTLDFPISDCCVDVENILNRISFPLCGRN